jgi:uncharacterized protein YjbJ (UPF0337 family)
MNVYLKGKYEQMVGKAKEGVGRAIGDRRTEWTGKWEHLVGKAKEEIGRVDQKSA